MVALTPPEALTIAVQYLSRAISCERIGLVWTTCINDAAAALVDAGLDDWALRCQAVQTEAHIARLIVDLVSERSQYAPRSAAE